MCSYELEINSLAKSGNPYRLVKHFDRASKTLPCAISLSHRMSDNQKHVGGRVAVNPAPACSPFFFEPVPINSASKELLVTIPGVGPKTAETIQLHIVEHGTIDDPAELMEVNGIGTVKLAKILPHISFR